MTETEQKLASLLRHINAALDLIHDEAIKRLNTMARQVGQRTRTDRFAGPGKVI